MVGRLDLHRLWVVSDRGATPLRHVGEGVAEDEVFPLHGDPSRLDVDRSLTHLSTTPQSIRQSVSQQGHVERFARQR